MESNQKPYRIFSSSAYASITAEWKDGFYLMARRDRISTKPFLCLGVEEVHRLIEDLQQFLAVNNG